VLLTDGENNTGRIEPRMAARMAEVKGIRVHTIGLGTLGGAPVPLVTPTGQRYFARDTDGSLLITRLDEASLKAIAHRTGGQYFRATDEDALAAIYRAIAAMEKHDLVVERITQYRERFPWLLLPALGLLLLEFVLTHTVFRLAM